MHQCALMFLAGASVVMVIPSNTWQRFEKMYSTFSNKFCVSERANEARFGTCNELKGITVEFDFMVQPRLWERKCRYELHNNDAHKAKNIKLGPKYRKYPIEYIKSGVWLSKSKWS